MIDRDEYLGAKQAQVNSWINELTRLDALCREAGDDVRDAFEVQLKQFSRNLNDLHAMFCEFEGLNDHGREKFRQLIEMNWKDLEESFKSTIADYEHLIRVGTGK